MVKIRLIDKDSESEDCVFNCIVELSRVPAVGEKIGLPVNEHYMAIAKVIHVIHVVGKLGYVAEVNVSR